MTKTRRSLAEDVARETGCHKNLAVKMVDCIFSSMRDSLINDDRIEIRGFGVFQVKETKPKPAARNPRTGESVYVPARRKTHFKPGKALKDTMKKQK
jgi:integration host factor subunit beta